jgi:HlyD family secretion protein
VLPGLSATARITTAKRGSVLAIPIQALTIRERGELTPENKDKKDSVQAATKAAGDPKEDLQGVFVIRNKKDAVFVPVTTGISGTTDIEVNSGLKEGDEIVTGSYKVLRTLRNGATVKIDNTVKPKNDEES